MRRKQTPKKVLMLHLDFDQYQEILEIADNEERSLQSIIRESIEKFLEKRKAK